MIIVDRLPNWRVRLFEYFDIVRRIPFNNDTNNCAQFIANGWSCVRPDDPFEPYHKYSTYKALLKAVKKDGFDNHADFYQTFMPAYEHVSQARVADIAIFDADPGDDIGSVPGWVIGERVFVLRPTGLATMELSKATKAFAV